MDVINNSCMRVGLMEVSAAHFIQTATDQSKCQRLHGHNYQVMVDIHGEIDPATHMITDATNVKNEVDKLDHRTIVPRSLCSGSITRKGREYIIFENPVTHAEYTVPKSDVTLLDVPAISAEYLSQFLANELLSLTPKIKRVVVYVSETSKMTAISEAERPEKCKFSSEKHTNKTRTVPGMPVYSSSEIEPGKAIIFNEKDLGLLPRM